MKVKGRAPYMDESATTREKEVSVQSARSKKALVGREELHI